MTIGNIHIKNKYLYIGIGVLIVVIIISVLNWISNTATLEVEVKNGENSEYSYNFTAQQKNQTTVVKTDKNTLKQFLPVDTYQNLVEQNYKSYFNVTSTSGFFANTFFEAILKSENKREFVGNNPQACMAYINNVLVSFGCDELLANASVHIPATPTLPTYTTTTRGQGPAGFNEGIFQTKDGSFALSHIPNSSENGQTHLLYRVGDNFRSTGVINITNNNLNRSIRYTALPYKNGFIAYNSNFTEIKYFPGFSNQADNIGVKEPQNSSNPISLDVKDQTILTAYKSQDSSLIYLNTNGAIEAYTVKKTYGEIKFCGEKYFCMLADGKLDIYELNNRRFNLLFSVINTKAFYQTNSALLLVTDKGVINLDIVNKNGFLAYSFGDYKYNSAVKTADNQGLVLNVSDPQNNKFALLLNLAIENTDNIDKKILKTDSDENIKTISIYKNFITIVPNVPADFNNPQTNTFDSSKVSKLNSEILNTLKSAGINTNIYKVHFTVR